MIVAAPMTRHLFTHLATVDDEQFETIKAICVSLGEALVKPMAEALSTKSWPGTRERITKILWRSDRSGGRDRSSV